MICEHKKQEYVDGMYGTAEPPYDGTDFWWSIRCEDCGEELALGDGYDKIPELPIKIELKN